MTAYAVPYVIRVICALFLLLAICGNGVILVSALYLQTGRQRLWWASGRGLMLAGLCLLTAELALCQLYLWEGAILQPPAFLRFSLIPGLVVTACCWFVFGEKTLIKVLSVILTVLYLFYMLPQPWFWLAGLGLSVAAFLETAYCIYYLFYEYDGASVSYILTGLSDNILHGLALYGKNGSMIERNRAYEAFCGDCSIESVNFNDLCKTLGAAESLEGRLTYLGGQRTYEITVENLSNRKRAVFVKDITAFAQTLESERKAVAQLVEQNRLMEELIKQQEQAEILRERKNALYELHDNAGQMLAVVSMSLEAILKEGLDRDAAESLEKITSILENYTRKGRFNMYYPLKDSLDRLKISYKAFGIEILEAKTVPPLMRDEEEAVAAICHEAVLNAIRHAKADRIEITWQPEPHVLLRIANEATKMDAFVPGIGISGMASRAKRVGMELETEIKHGSFIVNVTKRIAVA